MIRVQVPYGRGAKEHFVGVEYGWRRVDEDGCVVMEDGDPARYLMRACATQWPHRYRVVEDAEYGIAVKAEAVPA